MVKTSKTNLSNNTRIFMYICMIFTILLTIVSYIFLGISTSKFIDYNQSMLMAKNPGISYVAYNPSENQAEEMSKIQGVENVTTIRIIERSNLSFTADSIPFFAIETLNHKNDLEYTMFNNVLKGDKSLSDDEVYFDKTLYDKANLKLGDKISVSFGSTVKDFTLGGVVAPIRDVLTLNNDGVAIFNFGKDIDDGLTFNTAITCLTITLSKNNENSNDILSYLGSYKPLGNIQSFEEFDKNYRDMHNQGSYTDEEYLKIIQEAYKKYYDEIYQTLPNGQYSNKDTFFRDLLSSYELKSIKNSGNTLSNIYAIIFSIGILIQLIVPFFPNIRKEFNNSILEGLNPKELRKYITIHYDLPYWIVILLGYITFLIIGFLETSSISVYFYVLGTTYLIFYPILSFIRNKIIVKLKKN